MVLLDVDAPSFRELPSFVRDLFTTLCLQDEARKKDNTLLRERLQKFEESAVNRAQVTRHLNQLSQKVDLIGSELLNLAAKVRSSSERQGDISHLGETVRGLDQKVARVTVGVKQATQDLEQFEKGITAALKQSNQEVQRRGLVTARMGERLSP